MNREMIEKEVLGTKVNGEKEATPMGAFYKIKEGEDYSEDIIDELVALNNGAIKAHEEAIGILTFYNTALLDKKELQDKEKYINDATGWIDIISKDNMESLAAEFYWNAANDGDLDYSMEFLEEVIRIIDRHYDLDEEDSIDNIVNILKNEWKMKTTDLDKTIIWLIAREEGRHDIEYYQQKAKTVSLIS